LGEQYFYLDGAEEGVKYLKGKYRLYIVTNGIKHTQENRIEKSGLIRYADGVFISEAVGAGKPSKEYFDYVFDFTGADRKSSVIMGDSLTSDIKGGINAGIRTIWFNSKGLPPSDAIVPTCEIRGWDEVYKIL
ncbi:MAG: HAD-IA family hydrolase, partial [Christensenellales bacterium]